jgi:hypothetical protein
LTANVHVNVAVNGRLVAHTLVGATEFAALGQSHPKLQAVLVTLPLKQPFAFTFRCTFTGSSWPFRLMYNREPTGEGMSLRFGEMMLSEASTSKP